ncbi:unnamed protein product, partial [Staurois parvus]
TTTGKKEVKSVFQHVPFSKPQTTVTVKVKPQILCSHHSNTRNRGRLTIWELGHCPRARGQ